MTWRERIEDIGLLFLAINVLLCVSVAPIPVARNLWVWSWWGVMGDGEWFRFMGRRVSADEIGDIAGDSGGLWFLVPFSKTWRDVRHGLLRNMVIE